MLRVRDGPDQVRLLCLQQHSQHGELAIPVTLSATYQPAWLRPCWECGACDAIFAGGSIKGWKSWMNLPSLILVYLLPKGTVLLNPPH